MNVMSLPTGAKRAAELLVLIACLAINSPIASAAIALSAGDLHTCSAENSSVTCWGSDSSGQSTVPAGLVNPSQVSLGWRHTCAVDDNGVTCWGLDSFGQSTTPAGLINPSQVSAGGEHTCAVDDNGVTCWGLDGSGQSSVPVELGNPSLVSAGYDHTCALVGGGVTCWGSNGRGQTAVPDGLDGPNQVSAGRSHTCALDAGGVTCWGYNKNGQSSVPNWLVNPTQVSAGFAHSCAVDNGGVTCWGSNEYGQSTVPTGLVNPSQVSAGGRHTCAVDDYGVTCWGNNDSGQSTVPTGVGNQADTEKPVTAPKNLVLSVDLMVGRTVQFQIQVFDDSSTTISTNPMGSLESSATPEATEAGTTTSIVYMAEVPSNASPGQVFNDTITVTDASGNEAVITVQVKVKVNDTVKPEVTPSTQSIDLQVDRRVGRTAQYEFQVFDESSTTISTNPIGSLASETTPQSSDSGDTVNVVYTATVPSSALPGEMFDDSIVVEDSEGNQTELSVSITILGSGDSVGTTVIAGDYFLGDQDTLKIELSGVGYTEYDALSIGGSATFAGTLEVILVNDYMPSPGDSFTFTIANLITGGFENIILPDIGDNFFNVEINEEFAVISVHSSAAPVTPLPVIVDWNIAGDNDDLTIDIEFGLNGLVANNSSSMSRATKSGSIFDVFVGALVPGEALVSQGVGEDIWFLLDSAEVWGQFLGGPLPEFLRNVEVNSADHRIVLHLLRSADVSQFIGTTFFIGYGTSDTEMLESGRFRSVFIVEE